jgi:hypothetical protein
MKRKALEAPLTALRLHIVAPARVVDVDVFGDRTAVGADAIQRPAHVIHEQGARARFLDEQHHSRWHTLDVRQDRELANIDTDHSVRGPERRIRISGHLGLRGR